MFNPDRFVHLPLLTLAIFALLPFLIPAAMGADSEPIVTPLMISEVMPNAGQGADDHRHEWVEIQNVSDHAISLARWSIEDDTLSSELPRITLAPAEIALIVGSGSHVTAPPGATLIILESARIGSGLRNDGDRIALVDPSGITRDAMSWGDQRHPQYFESPEANHSIYRDRRGRQARCDSPTPFAEDPRSQAPPRAPTESVQLPDTAIRIVAALVEPSEEEASGEWVALQNTSDQRLITVGWTLSTTRARITLPSRVIRPGQTLLLASTVDRRRQPLPTNFQRYADDAIAIHDADGTIAGGLPRSGGHLIVRDPRHRWLATASWGTNERFHQLSAPAVSAILRFEDSARIAAVVGVDRDAEPPFGVVRLTISGTKTRFDLVNTSDEVVELDGWQLTLGGIALPRQTGQLGPGSSVEVSVREMLGSPLRLRDPAGKIVLTVPLPPVAGAAMDAIEINRSLQTEPPRYQTPAEPTVWISEVYPVAGMGRQDAAHEWFELANRSEDPANLDGWTIADNHGTDALDGITIPPKGVVVVAATNNGPAEADAHIADGRIGNGLANSGDRLVLISDTGVIVDAVSWGTDEEYSRADAPSAEYSLNRPTPLDEPVLATPTPGALPAEPPQVMPDPDPPDPEAEVTTLASNSRLDATPQSAAPEVVDEPDAHPTIRLTEIMPAPFEGEPEWIEIENYGNEPISLDGWTLKDGQSSTPLRGRIEPGDRLIISAGRLPNETQDAPMLVVSRIGNGLNNERETVALLNPAGVTIDSVSYGSITIPSPARGNSIALQPARWIVNAAPTPGNSRVTPFLEDAFTPAPSPMSRSNEGVSVIAASDRPAAALNPWVIVSAGLCGIILVLLMLRWRSPGVAEPEGTETQPVEFTHASDDERATDEEELPP